MHNDTPSGKVEAARKLLAATQSDDDIEWLLTDHPNEERALNRLLDDLLVIGPTDPS